MSYIIWYACKHELTERTEAVKETKPKVAFKELDVNSNCYIFPPFQSIVKLRDSVQLFFFIVGGV